MNREKRRNMTKVLKSKGYSKEEIDALLDKKSKRTIDTIPEGTKVMLDIKKMKEHPDYNKLTPKRREWVVNNLNKVFTVKYDDNHKENPTVVALEEDKIGWLFYVDDLKIVE